MIVLQVSHVKKSYDTVDVLEDASLIVRDGDRVGLVGGNGAGKSTLVRIVTGEETPDSGQVHLRDGVQVGYVSQYVNPPEDATVYEFVAEARAYLRKMEDDLRRLEQDMANPKIYENEARFEQISRTYDEMSREFEDLGGYAWQTDIRRVLTGLKFPVDMHPQKVASLSGGQKTRLSLARLLAGVPGLLVLDEPTNYLDTETLAWLEQYLKNYQGSMLVVSHDRYFLDEVTNYTVELESGVTTSYTGNYASYVEQKAELRMQQAKQYAHQQEEIAKLEMFVAKNLVRASTTKRAQSRRKMLERLDRIDKPSGDGPQVFLTFMSDRASGRDVLNVRNLDIGYAEVTLSTGVNLRLERGMRLAILGPNGTGKTTLFKTLIGQLPPKNGEITFGQHVSLGYYDQEQTSLDTSKTVLAHVWDEYPTLDRTTVRSALAQFLFRGEDVDKPVSGLSGGERSRLNLCRLMLQQANTLLMDEPTNHLDIPSKEALENALINYDGTLLFISHDRYFIDSIATHVGVLSKDGITMYIGNYSEYIEKLRENARIAAIDAANNAPQAMNKAGSNRASTIDTRANSSSTGASTGRRRIRSSDLRKARETVTRWEETATQCEEDMNETATLLSEAAKAQDVNQIYELEAKRQELETKHNEAITAWEEAIYALEELEAQAQVDGD